MSDGRAPLVVAPGAGTVQGPAGGPLTFKARTTQTRGTLTLFENVIAPGDGPPLHTHDQEAESWYVLEGTLRFRLGDELETAPIGSYVFVPPGTPHCFQNVGAGPARILVFFTAGGMETFFDGFAELPPGQVDPSVFAQLGRDSGVTVLEPPLAISNPLPTRCRRRRLNGYDDGSLGCGADTILYRSADCSEHSPIHSPLTCATPSAASARRPPPAGCGRDALDRPALWAMTRNGRRRRSVGV